MKNGNLCNKYMDRMRIVDRNNLRYLVVFRYYDGKEKNSICDAFRLELD